MSDRPCYVLRLPDDAHMDLWGGPYQLKQARNEAEDAARKSPGCAFSVVQELSRFKAETTITEE